MATVHYVTHAELREELQEAVQPLNERLDRLTAYTKAIACRTLSPAEIAQIDKESQNGG